MGSPAERTHGSASGDQAHVTWPPDKRQAPEQTTNHSATAPVAVTTEGAQSPPYPALPPQCQARSPEGPGQRGNDFLETYCVPESGHYLLGTDGRKGGAYLISFSPKVKFSEPLPGYIISK